MRSSCWRLISPALVLLSSTLFAGVVQAQHFYYSTKQSKLVFYHHDTKTFDPIGAFTYNGAGVMMVDIASDYEGNLFGSGIDQILYRIDRFTAAVTPVGNMGITAIALAFKPDGTLWAVGGVLGYANSLFKIDPITAVAQYKTTISAVASGDIAFNPKTGLLYMSGLGAGNDELFEVDDVTGASTNQGYFSLNTVAGMDFSGDSEKLIAMSIDTVMAMDGATPWTLQTTVPGLQGICSGMTKYHCVSKPVILLNGTEAKDAKLGCGSSAIVDGSSSQNVESYEWRISGKDTNGDFKSVAISGNGNAGSLDLVNDPRFLALEFSKTNERVGRDFTVELTTSCDPFEPKVTTQLTLHIDAIALLWDMDPRGINRPPGPAPLDYVHQYRAGIGITFKDTGTPLWASGKWDIDSIPVGTGLQHTRTFHSNELGPHTVTYEVNHTNKCVSRETRLLDIIDGSVYVPNAFSPNGDGLNDTFGPHFFPGGNFADLIQFEFSIYNRWGQRVFSAWTADKAWDGTFNRQAQEIGTYFWILKYQMLGGEAALLKGDVSLIR